MDTCYNKQETLPPPHETTAAHVHVPTSRVINMQDVVNTENNPTTTAATANTTYLNSNTLFDALPIDEDDNDNDNDDHHDHDHAGGDLDVISTKFTDTTSIKDDDTKTNSTVDTHTQYSTNVTQPQAQTQETKNMNINVNVNVNMKTQTKLVDYGMTDSEDSNSDSEESLSDSESTTSDNEENHSTKPNEQPEHEQSVVRNNTEFRENGSSSDSTSEYESDSSTSFSDIGACGVTLTPSTDKKRTPDKMKIPRTKGELTLDQLPPIEELKITVPEEECIEVGVVTSIIDQLVIVQSVRGTPACDIDTLFFLNRGNKPLGRVFDVLGPVSEPLYAIRFNSYEEALEAGVKPGTPVYCAPRTSHTSYVFVSELMKMKGSDASWEHNNEPPVACLDYSDDEEERQARRMLRNRKQSITEANKTNSLERNKKFEKQMNDKNLLMNERYKNQQNFTARNKKKPDIRPPMMNAAVGPPPPHPWMLHNPAAPMPRPQFWSAPPYQFAYPPYAPLAMFPQLDVTGVPGPRQHFVPPIMAPAPPPNAVFGAPFNPNIPPPIMRPQPVTYFPKPRHPPWVPPMNIGVNVLQPPRGNFGNGSSYTQ